jgi:adenylate cyclase
MADTAPKTASRSKPSARRHTRLVLAVIAGMVFTTAAGLLLHTRSSGTNKNQTLRLGTGLEQASYDLLLVARGDRPVNEAVMVYLDEVSHEQLGQPQNVPWDRALHARLVDRLNDAGAKAIVFDVVFSDANPDKAAADQALIEAVRRSGRVVLAADNIPIGPKAKQMIPPFEALKDVAANIGSAEMEPSSDLIIRTHTHRGDNPLSALSWAAAEFLELPSVTAAHAENQERWLNYYGRPGLVPWCSYYQALDTNVIKNDFFRDKVVFVGARIMTKFAGDRKDEYPSPFTTWQHSGGFMSGVEIQATMFLNLMRGDWISRWSVRAEHVVLILFGVLLGGGLVFFRPVWAAAAGLVFVTIMVALAYGLFVRTLVVFPWALVVVEAIVAVLWSVLFNSIQLYVQKRLFEFTLGLYLSPKLVAKFSSSPALLKPGAEKHQLTLLFSDIADFTKISEKMDSDELAAMMNEYFQGAVGSCVHRTDGTVVKYIGDAIFALWNAPEFHPDHAARACAAALHFRELSKQPVRGHSLNTRIGLHTGVANVGNFGSEDRVDYTAIGESVNLASRMEGLNKYLGTNCLISGATKKEVGDTFVTRRIGLFQLKGYEGLVEVHELVGFPEQAEESRAWREAFSTALAHFERRDLVQAESALRQVLALRPDDGPTKHYLSRIAEILAEADPNWPTHTVLKEK